MLRLNGTKLKQTVNRDKIERHYRKQLLFHLPTNENEIQLSISMMQSQQ